MEKYNVSNFTDEELFQLMDINNPTDRELEAKIYSLIKHYEVLGGVFGNRMKNFFIDVFERFFEDVEEGEEEEQEGFEDGTGGGGTGASGGSGAGGGAGAVVSSGAGAGAGAGGAKGGDEVKYIKNLDFTKGYLNPILKETIKRVVSIDSQFRDVTTYKYSTYYTFNLSETLQDVVSLKLYSVQIPYNWYTINQNYGSNFFYIKGVSEGINNGSFDFKVSVNYGNYNATNLVSALNTSLQSVIRNNTDICFGTTAITYDSYNCRSTVTMDITHVFTETNYYIQFPKTDVFYDHTNDTYYSIPALLGYENTTYSPFQLMSSAFYAVTVPDVTTKYKLDASSNSFTIVVYTPSLDASGLVGTWSSLPASTLIATIPVTFSLPIPGYYTASELMSDLNIQLANHPKLSPTSNISIIDASNVFLNGYKYQLSIRLNRKAITTVPNMKTMVVFGAWDASGGGGGGSGGSDGIIWTGTLSCFKFANTSNELQSIVSENPSITNTYYINTGPFIGLKCIAPGYNMGENDYTIQVANSTSAGYTLNEYLGAIGNGMKSLAVSTNSQIVSSIDNNDLSNYIEMTFDIRIVIPSNNFYIDTSGSFLNIDLGFPAIIDGSMSSITATSPLYSSYSVTETNNTFYVKSHSTHPYIHDSAISIPIGTYNSLTDLITQLNNTVHSYTQNNLYLANTTFSLQIVGGSVANCILNLNIEAKLTNHDYEAYLLEASGVFYGTHTPDDISFGGMYYRLDPSSNSWMVNLGFENTIYDLSTSTTNTVISGTKSVTENEMYLDGTNNYFEIIPIPDGSFSSVSVLKLTLDLTKNAKYTKKQIVNSMNRALAGNVLTAGSFVNADETYTTFRVNINRIYRAGDYSLVFFDTGSFTHCNFGPNASAETTTTDTTIGWILGFRSQTIYYLTLQNMYYNVSNQTYYYGIDQTNLYYYDSGTNVATITGDTSVNVNLYNYLLIVLDDYTQNHLNDGLVTTTTPDLDVPLPSYANKRAIKCNPSTNNSYVAGESPSSQNFNQLTNNALYSSNQILDNQNNKYKKNTFSNVPYVQDVFGLIPVKTSGLPNGASYVEFGGTLQLQERIYFGPVNIRRMTVKLLTDKGNVLDLNGQNWSFSLVAEQLYNPQK